MKVLVAQSYPTLCDLCTVAHQGPLSMKLSRQEYWSGSPFPTPGNLPNPEIKLTSTAMAGGFFTTDSPGKPLNKGCCCCCCCSVAQLCLTLCRPTDYSPPGSSVHGIFQARIPEWVAISYSRESSQPRDRTCISVVSCIGRRFFTTVLPGKCVSVDNILICIPDTA